MAKPTVKTLFLICFLIYLAIGATSYDLIAGSQTDWSQLVTYIWTLFWPFVILLGLFYYRPVAFFAALATIIIIWRIARWRSYRSLSVLRHGERQDAVSAPARTARDKTINDFRIQSSGDNHRGQRPSLRMRQDDLGEASLEHDTSHPT